MKKEYIAIDQEQVVAWARDGGRSNTHRSQCFVQGVNRLSKFGISPPNRQAYI